MVRIKINLDEIPDSFVVLDAGKYDAKLVECEQKESSTGNPMLVWTWRVQGTDRKTDLKSFTSLQPHALFGLKEHLQALGVKDGMANLDTDRLIGKKVHLMVSKTTTTSNKTGEEMEVNRVTRVSAAKPVGQRAIVSEIESDDLEDSEAMPF